MLDLYIQHISYFGIMLALILTGTGLPIPEEVLVIFAGVASNQEILNPWLALASCLVGALLGDLATYSIGRHFGHNVIREHPWVARFLTPQRERHIEEMIRRHGLKIFFLSRFLVGLRSPMYLTAGILRVPFGRFIVADAFCASTVIGLFFGLSYVFGENIQGALRWVRQAEIALTVGVVAAVVGVVLFFYIRRRHRMARANSPREWPEGQDETAEERKSRHESKLLA